MIESLALVLLLATSARAWSPEDIPTDATVPQDISAQWAAPSAPTTGKDWDKFYFRSELGEERTVWCRHKECDAAMQSGDPKKRVPLYYLVALPAPADLPAAAGATYWRAVLSAYAIHWEPAKGGGFNDVVTRAGTPLAVRPWRPFKKDDSWNIDGQAMVLPPTAREVVPAAAALMTEAKDWPPCWPLKPASYKGSAAAIKKLHPAEIEIKEASADSDGESELYRSLEQLASHPDASAYTTAQQVRSQAWAQAEAEFKREGPAGRFTGFEAKFLLCRAKRYDHFEAFHSGLVKSKDPEAFVGKWRRFVKAELSQYMAEVDGLPGTPKGKNLKSPWDGYEKHDYDKALARAGDRTLAALEGREPALAKGPVSEPHPEEMRKATDRVGSILDQVK